MINCDMPPSPTSANLSVEPPQPFGGHGMRDPERWLIPLAALIMVTVAVLLVFGW